MSLPSEIAAINGAQSLYDWFGYWPSFHDAEVLHLHLNRSGASVLSVHTWEITPEIDKKGFHKLKKQVVVEFTMEGISGLNLSGFNFQNVVSGIDFGKNADGYFLTLGPCHGLAGSIKAATVSIRLHPGQP